MISRKEGKIIAGRTMAKKFGEQYMRDNKELLSTTESIDDNILSVEFFKDYGAEVDIDAPDGGIQNNESSMPDFLMGVKVDLHDGKIIE